MKTFDIVHSILSNILHNDVPFALALRSGFKKMSVDPEIRGTVTALVGCELRHHLLFRQIVKDYFHYENDFNYTSMYIALANILFAKRLDDSECIRFAKEELLVGHENVKDLEIDKFFNYVKSTQELIPTNLAKDSPEFLSFRFNTPSWIINMWQKQFGKGIAFKTLKSNYHPALTTLRINSLFTSDELILEKPGFAKTEIEGIVSYSGNNNIAKTSLFEETGLFFEKMATKYVIDSLGLDPYQKVAIYASYPNNIYLDLAVRFSHTFSCDVMTNHLQTYLETKRGIERFALSNMHVYEIEPNSIVTCLSDKVDVFFVLPKNSSFDLLRSTPDYFLRFKQEQLDLMIASQMETLYEADKQLNVGGRIVYLVPTISNKEGHNLIENFTRLHPEYEIEGERQFFPFESLDSCLYYAVIRKKQK